MYINHLAEEKGEKHLKELIESVLEQNEKYHNFLEDSRSQITRRNSEISQSINDLFSLRESHGLLKKEIKEIGEQNAIKKQIKETQIKIDKLRRSSGFSKVENET